MAFRVRNPGAINFGIMAAAIAATHLRFRRASDNGQPVVVNVADVNAAAGEGLRLNVNQFAIKYLSGPLGNPHMQEAIQPYWDGIAFEIDAMTSSTQVVTDSGYSQQTYSAWAFDTPAD